MRQLWWVECCFDWMLAPLCNVTISKFKSYRLYTLNIKAQYMEALDRMYLAGHDVEGWEKTIQRLE